MKGLIKTIRCERCKGDKFQVVQEQEKDDAVPLLICITCQQSRDAEYFVCVSCDLLFTSEMRSNGRMCKECRAAEARKSQAHHRRQKPYDICWKCWERYDHDGCTGKQCKPIRPCNCVCRESWPIKANGKIQYDLTDACISCHRGWPKDKYKRCPLCSRMLRTKPKHVQKGDTSKRIGAVSIP